MKPISSSAANYRSSTAPTFSISASAGNDCRQACFAPAPNFSARTFRTDGGIQDGWLQSRRLKCDVICASTDSRYTFRRDNRPTWHMPRLVDSPGLHRGGVSGTTESARTFSAGELWPRNIDRYVLLLGGSYAIDTALEPQQRQWQHVSHTAMGRSWPKIHNTI